GQTGADFWVRVCPSRQWPIAAAWARGADAALAAIRAAPPRQMSEARIRAFRRNYTRKRRMKPITIRAEQCTETRLQGETYGAASLAVETSARTARRLSDRIGRRARGAGARARRRSGGGGAIAGSSRRPPRHVSRVRAGRAESRAAKPRRHSRRRRPRRRAAGVDPEWRRRVGRDVRAATRRRV